MLLANSNRFQLVLPFSTQYRVLKTLRKRAFETLWEKEKMLVTSIFSFSYNVLFIIKIERIVATLDLSSETVFNLDRSKISSFGGRVYIGKMELPVYIADRSCCDQAREVL